jgi:hypothetical protein
MLVLGLLPILGSVPISVIVRPHFLQVGLSVSDMAYSKKLRRRARNIASRRRL